VAFSDAASGVVLVLGGLALLLWTQRRRDHALLWLAVASALWGVRGVAYYGPVVPVPPMWFEQFNPLNVLLASFALTMSVLSLLDLLTPRRRRWLVGAAAFCVVALVVTTVAGRGGLFARAACQAAGFLMVGSLVPAVWRERAQLRPWRTATLIATFLALLVCALHDLMVVGGALPATGQTWVFWGFVLMLISFAAMSGQYVVATLNRAERANEELERHVRSKTIELEESYARLRDNERESARAQERERLLRDMHDGLGAQLMTALRGMERGALAPQQVAQSLQDSLDELRLLMDSTDMGHYLPGALAAWRNRWDHRLAAVGVALEWQIDESLDEVQLAGDTALQVMRILQEAAANIVKHAQARRMLLDARAPLMDGARELQITIRDDGRGVPDGPARTGARGLKNMQHRAAQIGASLSIAGNGEGGTCVTLRLPLEAQATSPRRDASIAASARDEIPSLR
jgi:signal transduction histidine kinase